MFLFNNSIMPNKVRIGWHFLSNKYAYRDAYSALKCRYVLYGIRYTVFLVHLKNILLKDC